jgi:hypothetical protein
MQAEKNIIELSESLSFYVYIAGVSTTPQSEEFDLRRQRWLSIPTQQISMDNIKHQKESRTPNIQLFKSNKL